MAYLKHIVEYINCDLGRKISKVDSKIVGIAEPMLRKSTEGVTQMLPSYVDHYGEGQYVGPEDHHDLIIYHTVNSIAVKPPAARSGYGDAPGPATNIASMSCVVFGRRDKLKTTGDEMALSLQANFPDRVSNELKTRLQFRTVGISVSDINLKTLQVFQEEFQGFAFFLKPEQFLFKLNYTIESTFLKACYSNC